MKKQLAEREQTLRSPDLFFNTPARLKYVKTIHTEIGHISDIVNRLALAHPEVSIRLSHNERVLLHTNGSGDVRQVLAAIYGMNVARNMIPIQVKITRFLIIRIYFLPEIHGHRETIFQQWSMVVLLKTTHLLKQF